MSVQTQGMLELEGTLRHEGVIPPAIPKTHRHRHINHRNTKELKENEKEKRDPSRIIKKKGKEIDRSKTESDPRRKTGKEDVQRRSRRLKDGWINRRKRIPRQGI